jgi:hypothetical protein
MDDKTLAVTRPAAADYPLLGSNKNDLLEIFRDNLGDAGLSSLDLPRIKVPSGGSLSWNVRNAEGEEESVKELEGLVLAWRPGRLRWKKAMGEGGGRKPPDCTSTNGFIGIGDPGGECSLCPYAKFGSSAKGHGQACKQIRQLLIVRPGEVLPHMISIPPTSLKPCAEYFLMLFGRSTPFWAVTTKLRLEKSVNEDGIEYAKVRFAQGRVLTQAEREELRPFHEQMKTILAPMAIDVSDYREEGPPETEGEEPY